ncbi:MAG: aquaporin [Candidatus Eremiobacteraeota bacterium]|nr:aquaporin [Candidatus Eremiobacteraeota bacterium]
MKEQQQASDAQRLYAELFGTFLLTFVAAGAEIIDVVSQHRIGHIAKYASPALLVMAMIYSISEVSGAHINPAVTLAFYVRGMFPLTKLPGYLSAQLAGGILAALLLKAFFGALLPEGASKPGVDVGAWTAFAMEILLTTILVFVIISTAEEKPAIGPHAAIAVGGTIALCGLFASPISGASMNPARSLGPQLISGTVEYSWIYVLAPLLGAVIAVGLCRLIHGSPSSAEREAASGKGS